MALKISPTSVIAYPAPLIPTTGAWGLMFKFEPGGVVPAGNHYIFTISNAAGTKTLSLGFNGNTLLASFNELSVQSFNLTNFLGFINPNSIFIDYDPPVLRLWNNIGATTSSTVQNVANGFTGMSKVTLGSGVGLTYCIQELAVWSDKVFVAEDLVNLSTVPGLHYPAYRNYLTFYEKYLIAPNNPYRLGGAVPTYTDVNNNQLVDQRSVYPTTFSYDVFNYRENMPVPSEYIIEINHSLQFSQNNAPKSTEFNDTIRFVNTLGQSIRYITFGDIIRCTGEIVSNIKVQNIPHMLLLIEQWEKEHDTIEPSTKNDYIQIIESITRNIDVTRAINNEVTFAVEAQAYKQTPAENFGG